MAQKLNIVGIQEDLIWEQPNQNREKFEQLIHSLSTDVDLVVLPEMFTTGFTMNAKKVAETLHDETVSWMQELAYKHQIALVGSIPFVENNHFYNRLFFVHPTKQLEFYNKKHTFTLAGEHLMYKSGHQKLVVNYKGFRICPFICYDLRFPVWCRNDVDYDVLIFIASWPDKRINAWDILLKARAIENMCYVVGVNRVGTDENGLNYTGNSLLIDYLGETLSSLQPNACGIIQSKIDLESLVNTRKKLGFLNDKDAFTLL